MTRYDQEAGKTVIVSSRLKGRKNMPGETEVALTCSQRPHGSGRPQVTRRHVGLVDLLKWAGKASGVESDLHGCLEAGDADKILPLAWCWLRTDGDALPRMER